MHRLFVLNVIFLCVIACAYVSGYLLPPSDVIVLLRAEQCSGEGVKRALITIAALATVGLIGLCVERIMTKAWNGVRSLLLTWCGLSIILIFFVNLKPDPTLHPVVGYLCLSIVLICATAILVIASVFFLDRMRINAKLWPMLLFILNAIVLSPMRHLGPWGVIPVLLGIGLLIYARLVLDEDEPVLVKGRDSAGGYTGSSADASDYSYGSSLGH